MNSELIVEMLSIRKVYPDGTVALRGVDFEVRKGEIHGLLGENGAGKTTLMKILSGLLPLTEGEIRIQGKPVQLRSTMEGLKAGIGIVHQHFALVPPFTALQNIFLGEEGGGPLSPLKLEEARKKVGSLIEKVGLKVPLDTPVESLPVGVQQRAEILKILYRNAEILILDEPTASLTPLEVDELFQILRALKKEGKTIVFITHKLKEVLEITDRITVLRNGKVTGKLPTKLATPDKLAVMMIGKKVVPGEIKKAKALGQPVLIVKDLVVKNDLDIPIVNGVSFKVRSGEIFGIAGVEGNGQSELVQAITGLRTIEKGEIRINGVEISRKNPVELYRMGLAHIPEDKRKLGLILDFDVAENSILGLHKEPKFSGRVGYLNWKKVYSYAIGLIERFGVITPSIMTNAKSLSGGNQQRLVAARELSKPSSLIVAAHPTRGLDVAATHYIRELLIEMRDVGKAVLLISADLDEVTLLSDRIAVMYEGKFIGLGRPSEFNRRDLGLMMGGVKAV